MLSVIVISLRREEENSRNGPEDSDRGRPWGGQSQNVEKLLPASWVPEGRPTRGLKEAEWPRPESRSCGSAVCMVTWASWWAGCGKVEGTLHPSQG